MTEKLQEIIDANITVHTIMADKYNNEPHFRPENQQKVRAVLENIQKTKQYKSLLDIGCGTGFIINLSHDLFPEIHGVDVTQAMLDRVDTSHGNITLHNSSAENLPFHDKYFDLVTAYAFIHHVQDYRKILQEVFRVLKENGTCYIDLEPNKLFWQAMVDLEKKPTLEQDKLSAIVKKEVNSVLHTDDKVLEEFNIDKEVFNKAEYTKSILGGIDPLEFEKCCKEIGFASCEISYQWFLGQGSIMHEQSFQAADDINSYLQNILPLSAHTFKYLRFILTK